MRTEQEIAELRQLHTRRMLEGLLEANEEGRLKVTKGEWHRKEIKLPPGQGVNGSDRDYTPEKYYEITCIVYPRLDNGGGEPL